MHHFLDSKIHPYIGTSINWIKIVPLKVFCLLRCTKLGGILWQTHSSTQIFKYHLHFALYVIPSLQPSFTSQLSVTVLLIVVYVHLNGVRYMSLMFLWLCSSRFCRKMEELSQKEIEVHCSPTYPLLQLWCSIMLSPYHYHGASARVNQVTSCGRAGTSFLFHKVVALFKDRCLLYFFLLSYVSIPLCPCFSFLLIHDVFLYICRFKNNYSLQQRYRII